MKRTLPFLCLIILLLTACAPQAAPTPAVSSDGGSLSDGTRWPTKGWATSTPAEQGMDAARLDQMQAAIKAQNIPLDSLLIIRNGYIVSETYYNGGKPAQTHTLYSVTKSFISTLLGIALDQGKLTGVDQKVVDLLPGRFGGLDANKQAMTLENLLTMTSGLAWDEGDATYSQMYRSADWIKLIMDRPMTGAPGKTFLYCSGCTHVLSAVLQQQVGDELAFAEKNLFKPLGITNYRWEKDAQGILIGGWGLNLTSRDMAKLGYLYLHQGMWDGKQVVSSSWVKAATTKRLQADERLGYGYQWWIYPTHNAYTALGRAGQTIFVAPQDNLIIVTTADLPEGHDPIFALIDDYILPALVK